MAAKTKQRAYYPQTGGSGSGAGLSTFAGVFTPSILTMFFFTEHGVLTITAGLERFLGNPSFRPKFKAPWIVSVIGTIGCGGVMFLIYPLATWIAVGFVVDIYIGLEHLEMRTAWGDVRRGVWRNITGRGLMRLRTTADVKNGRPHFPILSGSPTKRWPLIEFASSLSQNRVLTTVASVLPEDSVSTEHVRKLSRTLYDYLDRHGIQALVRMVTSSSPSDGAEQRVAAYGLGTVAPKKILRGDSEQAELREDF